MAERLRAEIKQRRPFSSPMEEAFLNVIRTADVVQRRLTELLKSLGLTTSQYNVLRILGGAGEPGWTCGEIGERMLTRDPDVTRLLDRLHARGLIARERSEDDRRVVRSRITKLGLQLLDQAERPVRQLHGRLFGQLSQQQLRTLTGMLEAVRSASG